jgi:hypothetical protein
MIMAEAAAKVPVGPTGWAQGGWCDPGAWRDRLAAGWGAGHVSIGPAGHVNTASGHGPWEAGRALLDAFTVGLGVA